MTWKPTAGSGTPGNFLWVSYLIALGWLLLPFYATVAGALLPLDANDVQALSAAAIVLLGPLAGYVSRRGGPLLLSRPTVLYSLRGRDDHHRLLARSAMVHMFVLGVAGLFVLGILNLMTTSPEVEFGAYATASGVGAFTMTCGVAMTLVWAKMVSLGRAALVIASLGIGVSVANFDVGLWTIVALTALTAGTTGLWLWLPARDSIPEMWRRAEYLGDVQSSVFAADVRSAILAMRRATDGPRADRRILRTPRRWGALWRPARSVATLPTATAVRLAIWAASSAVLLRVMPSAQSGLLAGGFALLLASIDATTSIDSLCASWSLQRGRVRSPRLALAGELLVGSVVVLSLSTMAWLLPIGSPSVGLGRWLAVALASSLAAGLQARLGRPNLADLLQTLGPDVAGVVLAFRGMLFLILWFLAVAAAASPPVVPESAWLGVWLAVVLGAAVAALRAPEVTKS